ncbi:cadherin-like beta sandwich domain-containing protein [uncultured Nitratireductor sp.]|uniref:cadherin-like beta sandwich domain-containing protein n=1 Tax=uncultured Nitratireductor sp. TaxID=520953 RepID=UPI0025E2E6F6|nr:cadherin-like beta sandwich domain-containing protein [uncultured Nitratireductor sp.]
MIDVSACDGPSDGGMSGPIAPFAQHGTVTIGSNSGGTQFVTYAHSGDAATSDQFALEDNDLGVVTVNITIDPPVSPITVSPGSLPSMTAGTAFSQSLSATGGTAPYTYSLQSGSLPVGISLTSGGLLSGTPTQRGGYAFTVRATDDIGQFVDKGYTGTVLNPTISIAPTSATAIQGIALSQTIFASGGVGPYTFAVESGLLPVGISLSSSGLLSGTTSSAPGSYPLMLRVTDSSTGPGVYFELENFTLTVAPAPSVSISVSPASVNEDSVANLVYTVTRSQNLSSSTIVNLGYTGSADGSDYTGETLTVTIPAGSTSGIVVINPNADVTVEADETVIVSIQSGTGYTIGAPSSATGTILNDDLGTLTINDVTIPEGDSGTQTFPFTISLSQPAGPSGVTFDITTADLTATAGEDYQAKSIVGATIAPGESTYSFDVDVYGDTTNEPNERFFVNITNVTNAILGDGQGVGTIVNDDLAGPSITNISPNNGPAAGGTSVTITGTNFTGATAVTFGGTAAASFTVNSSTTISAVTPAGTAGAVDVAVTTPGGTNTETGGFTYTAATLPELSIDDVTVGENGVNASFTITLSAPAGPGGVTFDLTTADGPAVAGDDYYAFNGSGFIPEGEDTYYHGVGAISDAIDEPDETFFLDISNVVGATLVKARGTATINDDAPTITVAPASLSDATVGAPYSATVTASGGTGPYTYAVTAGALPGGLTLTSSGTLSGTPTAEGTFNFTITATDSSGGNGPYTGSRAYTIAVAAPTVTVSPATLPAATVAVSYSQSLTASGGTAPYSYAVTVGALPSGMNLSSVGVLSGTPTAGGTFNFTITATDDSGGIGPYTGSRAYTLTVAAPVIALSPGTLPSANQGVAYAQTVTASGGTAPYTYSITGGSLPPGTSMSSAGAFSGTPTANGTFNFTVTATDGSTGTGPFTGSQAYSLQVNAGVPPIVTSVSVPANGSYRAGDVLSFVVNFNESVVVDTSGGTPSVPVTIGATTSDASYAAGSGSNALVFQYVVNPGDLDTNGIQVGSAIELNGGTIANVSSTPADLALNNVGSTSGVLVDAVAPTVLSSAVSGSPLPDATTADFSVTFAEPVTGVDASDFALTTSGAVSGTISGVATADNITYVVSITGVSGVGSLRVDVLTDGSISDGAGNAMVAAYTSGTPWVRGGSADATLSNLAASAGTLAPAFDPSTTAYAVAVDNATDSVTLTPTTTEPNAGITVDGQSVVSGSASQSIALAVGSTVIPVVVTAEDGVTTQTYTVTVTRAASADATLASLTPSAGSLDPAFSPSTAAYVVAVDNATDSIALTPTAAEPNVTITVSGQNVVSGSASQAIALAVGSTVIEVVVTAEDATTIRTYTVTVTRAASANARLASLMPSVGALDPGFNPDSVDYAVAVANAVDRIALTPTADDADATITVNGHSVASGGVSQAIALPVGSTAISVVVIAGDGATTRTYTVTAMRAQPVPTVVSREIEINAGETASVDLTEGATGGPFTDAAIVDLSDADAGSARIERDGQTYRLVFASSSTYAGGADVRFTLSNATGTSAPGTIAFTIVGRPNPAQDPEVIGLLNAQTDAARRFAQAQTKNFNDRLEQLHDEGDRRRSSMNLSLGYNAKEKRGDRETQQLVERAHDVPGLLGYASTSDGRAPSDAFGSNAEPEMPNGSGGIDLGAFAVWTGGYINFGGSDDGALDLDHTMVGVSAGVDYRFSRKFVAGFGVGFGRDRTDVGANGTQSTGRAYSAAIYGSYKPFDNFFLDGVVGGSWLDFDSRRYVTATGDFATGNRSGHQVFGSLTAAYEFRDDIWLVSPYGRVEMSRTWLDGFTEEGGGDFGLGYGEQSIDTVSGVIGIRAKYAFRTSWGTLTPGARVEYTHDFAGSSRIHLGYIDMDRLPYWLDIEASSRSYMTLGLSLDAELPQAWTLGFDYRTAFGNDSQDHAFGLEIAKRF